MTTVAPYSSTAEYDELPVGVKMLYTFEEWLWLDPAAKAQLVAKETMPETFED